METFEIISIQWEYSGIRILDVYNSQEFTSISDEQNILYQVYGFSPIYGNDKLLYIGLTSKDYNTRISQHLKRIFSRGLSLEVVIGKIDEKYHDRLEEIESILIAHHKPSYNSKYITKIKMTEEMNNVMIHNHGYKRDLLLECSNIWWLDNEKK